jgi:hypothetical protein
MSDHREELLERVARAIDILQAIQAGPRTPIETATDVVEPIRKLTECRRALRAQAFEVAANMPEYSEAIARLKQVTDSAAMDLDAFEGHAAVVTQAMQAADAVLRLAIATGVLLA